jgi:hypothetical protein
LRDHDPIRTARRSIRRQERESQGLAVPPCVLSIEEHHTAGRHHDAQLTVTLCQKHHREIHEKILRAGVSLTYEPNKRKRVAKALRAIAVYDHAEADAKERLADLLDDPTGEC